MTGSLTVATFSEGPQCLTGDAAGQESPSSALLAISQEPDKHF